MKKIDLTGQRFGKLIALKEAEPSRIPSGAPVRQYLCQCDCGTVKTIRANDLRGGRSRSCGCLRVEAMKRVALNHNSSREQKSNMAGQRFSNLLVIAEAEPDLTEKGQRKRRVMCRCDCGQVTIVKATSLRSGNTKSCGCLQAENRFTSTLKHGHNKIGRRTKTYISWCNMKQRCLNPRNEKYQDYGGRGIKICKRWLTSFENFLEDMGEKPKGLTLDRIDNDGNYEPGNCRWATQKEQQNNRRNTPSTTISPEIL